MARTSYVQINGVLYDKSQPLPEEATSRSWPTILPDLPDFVSPIDGTIVRGRAGMREHCAKHNVVPTADLKGLPTTPPRVEPDRAAIKQELIRQLYHK
jgi:hypothetical protein